ncbi:hypothetical protein BDW67DRAFT_151108 [Aspergillus spinulosporus]
MLIFLLALLVFSSGLEVANTSDYLRLGRSSVHQARCIRYHFLRPACGCSNKEIGSLDTNTFLVRCINCLAS